jgi:hypothetical protein
MMYSKRKTLHYITKEMYFLYNTFVTDRLLTLNFKVNTLLYKIVLKKTGKDILFPRLYYYFG